MLPELRRTPQQVVILVVRAVMIASGHLSLAHVCCHLHVTRYNVIVELDIIFDFNPVPPSCRPGRG